ncbi:MAG: site-2 protease family protein [Chloroflexi bacterium]|nr:site-2 protease family protein [Chloroflexota bacterium]
MFSGLTLPLLISRALTLVIAFTVHEFAHAWAAEQQGDPTARLQGRLTLNPLTHLDPLGSLLLIVAGFGWAKPVPFNPYNLRSGPRTGTAIVAAAGPFSNLALALLAAIPFKFGLVTLSEALAAGRLLPSASNFLLEFIWINLILLFFNLIPLPPLDGHKIAVGLLPDPWAQPLERLTPYGPMILMLVIFVGPMLRLDVVRMLIVPPTNLLFLLLVG